MTELATTERFDQANFEQLLQSLSEPDWLTQRRQEAFEHFQTLDMPTTREEEWKRTDIRLFKLDRFSPPRHSGGTSPKNLFDKLPTTLLDQGLELAGKIITTNGQNHESHLTEKWQKKGILFGTLEQLLPEHGDLLKPYLLKKAFETDYDKFAALHGAFFQGGLVLYVPRGVVVDDPLFTLAAISDGQTDLSHTLVILEEGAEASLVSELTSPKATDGGLHCGGVELYVADNAHFRYVNLQNWGKKVWHFAQQRATVGQNSSLQWTAGALGSKLSKVNQHVLLEGTDSHCQVNGVMFAEESQHLDYHTLQHHKAPNCRSDFLYKVALQDTARTVWRGMIKVDKEAQRTDGYQRNDNLLLTQQARSDSIPGLEIEADDVRCTHGATTSKVEEELIFYARTRGFTRKEAVRMIVNGFFQQVFDRITLEPVREALGQAIASRVRDYS
ncbi:MAG: Fe-S cluster assembly protein SufD [Pirellulaceae bacterium]|nr:Fe-S cluster assembly protein SufD [Pirellulaceae bacterium]